MAVGPRGLERLRRDLAPAPARFSTTTGRASSACSPAASWRAIRSVEPPAGKPTEDAQRRGVGERGRAARHDRRGDEEARGEGA